MNPLDLQARRGDYRDQVALPAVIGNNVSGVVVESGPGAGDFKSGEEVWCLAPVGPMPSSMWSTRPLVAR
ncbi:NADPH:quinone reductase-like Zn-dependent oxidoreductase [Amycolatopsis umgeniensis]|uniref:NADPH:quinone reductase-like Zn-dependent oxidoreductase n=1 Tax=Amycolatopsis umgeniensis TaxID=336628 RepID=A0A841ASP6_9PSEU|nr:NADPH:quinone reductase-like Zn-dependent oxidoreductase [Amycolatopsis umgeniensis]